MAKVIPILRIFDYSKAIDFYIKWLGFEIVWEYKELKTPVYFEIAMNNITFHLSEHHGDGSPGVRIFIDDFPDLRTYHQRLIQQDYIYNRPGLETPFYDKGALEMTVIDPFGNRITFVERSANTLSSE